MIQGMEQLAQKKLLNIQDTGGREVRSMQKKSVEGSQENEQLCFSEIKNSGISDKISGSNFETKKTQFS